MIYFLKSVLFTALLILVVAALYCCYLPKPSEALTPKSSGGIKIHDPKLRYEVVATGLRFPTTMAFLGPNDILVNEKNDGTVQRIIDGKIQPQSVLDVSVANKE